MQKKQFIAFANCTQTTDCKYVIINKKKTLYRFYLLPSFTEFMLYTDRLNKRVDRTGVNRGYQQQINKF